jgi:hypothetical protein
MHTVNEMTDSELAHEILKHQNALKRTDTSAWTRETLQKHLDEYLAEQAERAESRSVTPEEAASEYPDCPAYPDTWTYADEY